MNRVTDIAEECNIIPTANKQNNAAFAENISTGNLLSSSGEAELEKQLHDADKCNAKIHYLSRAIARDHGIIPSVILTGLAYKLKFHMKNKWKDRWWYYDPIEVLRTHRWPYLSDGCICENVDYLIGEKLLIKDCNNKLSYDRTSWYAMEDDVRERALSDLAWFDVAVTRKLDSIPAGLIYHNIRHHLREIAKKDAECQVPYHKLNVSMLARLLPMSVSTAKRCVKELVKSGLVVRHANKRNLYTIADEREYREIGSKVNAIGSSANAIGSKVNGSSANAIGSKVNANGSKVNAIGSKVNDNTQYETNGKPFINQSQKDVCVVNNKRSSDVRKNDVIHGINDLDHKFIIGSDHELTIGSDQKIISDAVGSIPPGGKENTDAAFPNRNSALFAYHYPKSFEQLIHQTAASVKLLQSLDKNTQSAIRDLLFSVSSSFVKDKLPATTIYQLWGTTNNDQLVQALSQPFADYVMEDVFDDLFSLTKEETWQLFYYPQLETLVRAFASEHIFAGTTPHTMENQADEMWDTNCALYDKMEKCADFSPLVKRNLFKQAISIRNRFGWILRDELERTNAVQTNADAFKRIEILFEANPHLSASNLIAVLNRCIDVAYFETEPDGFDKYWAARQGINLNKFTQCLDRIVTELKMFDVCPITAMPEKETN